MQTCSLGGGDQPGVRLKLCTWDSARWRRRRRHVRHRRSWTAMLERCSGGRRSREGGRRRGGWKERMMGGSRGGQALADRRLSGIDRRWRLRGDGLSVLREEARRLRRRSSRGGVLKRLIDRHPTSSRWVLADLRVGWESPRTNETLLVDNCCRLYWRYHATCFMFKDSKKEINIQNELRDVLILC